MPEPTDDPRPATREADLDDRLRRLEAALADRPAPAIEEDTVADRVIAKLSAIANGSHPLPESDRVLVLDTSTGSRPFPPPPSGAVLHPAEPLGDPAARTWFLAQVWTEIRLAARMYFDPRYRISRTTQFALPGIALALVFNYFFFAVWVGIPFLSPVAERMLAVILAVFGYKILARELARYRVVLEYLSRYAPR